MHSELRFLGNLIPLGGSQGHGAASTLSKGWHFGLGNDPNPFERFHVKSCHAVFERAALELTPEDEHCLLVKRGAVVFTGASMDAFSYNEFQVMFVDVVLHQLVCALAQLPLGVECEAPSESVDFVPIGDAAVALPRLDRLIVRVGNFLPDNLVTKKLAFNDILANFIVEPTNEEHPVVADRERRALSWRWLPLEALDPTDVDIWLIRVLTY